LKIKVYALIGLLTLIILPIVPSSGLVQLNVVLSSSGTIQQNIPTNPDVIISLSGTNINVSRIDGTQLYLGQSVSTAFYTAVSSVSNPVVFIRAGTYTLTQTLTWNSVSHVELIFEDNAKLFVSNYMNSPAIHLQGVNNWLIQNPTIDGNMLNQEDGRGNQGLGKALFGILIEGGSNNLVDGATITNCGQFGVFISNPSYSSPAVNNGVINSEISYCGWNAITVGVYQQPAKDTDDYFKNNVIHNCDDVGISTYATRSLIENNTIYDDIVGTGHVLGWNNAGTGIQVEGGSGNTIRYNTVTNCKVGIQTNEPPYDYNTITYNTITHCIDGIAIRSSHNTVTFNTITDYNFQNGWNTAISLLNSNDNDINDNKISTSHIANAIYIGSSSNDNRVLRNNITASQSNTWSIWIESSSRNDVEQNNISGFNGIGVTNAACMNTILKTNDLRSCTGTKISDLGTGTTNQGNLL
jgi:hypothetical protein